jgi:hypothetical protein
MNLTGDRCQCSACWLYFNSTRAFEKHRHGEYGVDRRCMSEPEMRSKGMEPGARGAWVTARNLRFTSAAIAKAEGK